MNYNTMLGSTTTHSFFFMVVNILGFETFFSNMVICVREMTKINIVSHLTFHLLPVIEPLSVSDHSISSQDILDSEYVMLGHREGYI